jgi:hypothetical protein
VFYIKFKGTSHTKHFLFHAKICIKDYIFLLDKDSPASKNSKNAVNVGTKGMNCHKGVYVRTGTGTKYVCMYRHYFLAMRDDGPAIFCARAPIPAAPRPLSPAWVGMALGKGLGLELGLGIEVGLARTACFSACRST